MYARLFLDSHWLVHSHTISGGSLVACLNIRDISGRPHPYRVQSIMLHPPHLPAMQTSRLSRRILIPLASLYLTAFLLLLFVSLSTPIIKSIYLLKFINRFDSTSYEIGLWNPCSGGVQMYALYILPSILLHPHL